MLCMICGFRGRMQTNPLLEHGCEKEFTTHDTNSLYNNLLSNMETSYRVFKRSVVQNIPLHSRGFECKPEIIA